MSTNQREYDIIAGPNKDALFDACKYACVDNATIPISFEVARSYTMPAKDPCCVFFRMEITDYVILGIENEDGSGESFNLYGCCKLKSGDPYQFEAYYNTKYRKGVITFFN